jgi:hypothetical protein
VPRQQWFLTTDVVRLLTSVDDPSTQPVPETKQRAAGIGSGERGGRGSDWHWNAGTFRSSALRYTDAVPTSRKTPIASPSPFGRVETEIERRLVGAVDMRAIIPVNGAHS